MQILNKLILPNRASGTDLTLGRLRVQILGGNQKQLGCWQRHSSGPLQLTVYPLAIDGNKSFSKLNDPFLTPNLSL
jgi:hypothetical protein